MIPNPPRFKPIACAIAAMLLAAAPAFAVNCETQAQMPEAERADLLAAARSLASMVQSGDAAAVEQHTISSVRSQFTGIANSIRQTAPAITRATIAVSALYLLDASDIAAAQPETQFFCEAANSSIHVEVGIPQLPKGKYALALVHATGVAQPQQFALLLQRTDAWQLAGFFVKPMLVAGHDGVWYWTKARQFNGQGQKWDAYFYYTVADYLATPADFLDSSNLDKLRAEEAAAKPAGLPGAQPMVLTANGQSFPVVDLHTDGSLGGLDLVIRFTAADIGDPVASRARNIQVMNAMLGLHPELRQGFHGLWVFAEAKGQQPFGIELPMSEIH
jgi:hypothetical protein